ncbi:hypothetical protein JK358_37685 [Nocardia sp. 2]|uniref:Secreted protein n=1 Tax=Nocardia acididurans TaxID=2802282 RepID=A0ABS1MHK1_9NOCA|nr:hypothetical protein [Nocardia acididurans]MBL1080142.1 hypothetical protein [Nocardia acididurans]
MKTTSVTRKLFGAAVAVAFTAFAGSVLTAGPAAAGVDGVSVLGRTPGTECGIAAGCSITTGLSGTGKLELVEFLVNGAVIGTAYPTVTNGLVSASHEWWPTAEGTYTVGVRQGVSMVSVVHNVGRADYCSLVPSGSAGSGSAGSGSAGSGSASGSFGSGSAGSGSAGSGSASGSGC